MTSNYKNSMYPRNFLCEEAKIKQRTSLKKELCEFSEDGIWESRFTSFFNRGAAIVTFKFSTILKCIPLNLQVVIELLYLEICENI